MSQDAALGLVKRFFDDVCNGRRLDVSDQLFSATHVYHDPQSPTGPGPQGMNEVIANYHRAFGDARWTVDEMIDVGNGTVVTRWTGSGTQSGELMGLPPSRKPVKVPGIWIHRVAADKIVESWNCWDTLGMLQQLGAVPKPQSAPGVRA